MCVQMWVVSVSVCVAVIVFDLHVEDTALLKYVIKSQQIWADAWLGVQVASLWDDTRPVSPNITEFLPGFIRGSMKKWLITKPLGNWICTNKTHDTPE